MGKNIQKPAFIYIVVLVFFTSGLLYFLIVCLGGTFLHALPRKAAI